MTRKDYWNPNIWGEHRIYEITVICEQANPDIIDINYGCPVKKLLKKGAGAGILQDIPKMVKMTKEIVNQPPCQ